MQRGSLKPKNLRGVKVWRLQWREDGHPRTRILGRCQDMSRAEAEAERRKIMAPLNAKATAADTSPVTLRRYVEEEYLTLKTRVWKGSTRGTTEQIIETHILLDLGNRALASISRKELQALLDQMARAQLSFSVVDHVHRQFTAIFRMAKADGLITANPAEGLITPKCKDPKEKRTLAQDMIHRAEMVLDGRELLIFHLAVYHGMRPGEILGLQLGDIHGGVIRIVRRNYRGVIDTPKSYKGRRSMPVMEKRTEPLVQQWLEMLPDRRPEAWLFPSETGATAISYSNLYRRRIQPALAKVGLGDVNFLIMRRTYLNELDKAEKDATVRAQLAGHSVDVDENVYRQPHLPTLRRAMRKLERRLQ